MSSAVLPSAAAGSRSGWRDVVMPREHGSWSLALEPVVFGWLVAPSMAGGFLSVAALAGFLARRPLKLALKETRGERRDAALAALGALLLLAAGALAAAVAAGGSGWLVWLWPSALAGVVFLGFDLRNGGREEFAEIAGAAAFAGVSAAMAAAAGWTPTAAWAVLFVMAGRAVPTVMFVRAYVRGAKTGELRPAAPLLAAGLAAGGAFFLGVTGGIPATVIVAFVLLFVRAAIYLLYPRPRIRPRTLGFQELALGVAFIVVVATAWRT